MEKNQINTNNPIENASKAFNNKISRRGFLLGAGAAAAAAGLGAIAERKTEVISQVEEIASDTLDRASHIVEMLNKSESEREVALEEVLPVLFGEVIKELLTSEGQALLNISPADEEWTFARDSIENDTGIRGPYGEGSVGFGIHDVEGDDSKERFFYGQMFSVNNATVVWAIRDKESWEILERGVDISLRDSMSDEQDITAAMKEYLTLPEEVMDTNTTELSWRSVDGQPLLQDYKLEGRGPDSNYNNTVHHSIHAHSNYLKYSTEKV